MHSIFAAVSIASVLAAAPSPGQRAFPYQAYVTAQDVYARSGPGKNYYPTAKLQAGDRVEVYRHDPGGWYAIKPPKGSFTWVSGRYLELQEGGLGNITGDRVAARVGTQFSDMRDVIQVRLHQGEAVEILESKQFGSDPDSGLWYRIAPPSGEFRWVHGRFVDPDYDHDGVRKTTSEANPLVPGPSEQSQSRQRDRTERDGQSVARYEERDGDSPSAVRTADHIVPIDDSDAPPESTAGADPEPKQTWSDVAPASVDDSQRYTNQFRVPAKNADGSRTLRRISPDEFQAELEEINLEMAIMLAEEPTVWHLDELALRTGQLAAQAETALERGRARLLERRIAKSQEIKNRHGALEAVQAASDRRDRQLTALGRTRDQARPPAPEQSQPRFDGTGRLARVVNPKIGAPRYALVDENGDVRCFVTPAPGINMQYYLGKQIGVTGVRGYIAEQQAQHVTAKHISPLQ